MNNTQKNINTGQMLDATPGFQYGISTLLSKVRYLGSAIKLWRARPVQALLSTLGIVAGVCGLVLVIALGEGANRELDSALGVLGAGSVLVRQVSEPGSNTAGAAALTIDKAQRVERLLGSVINRSSMLKNSSQSAASSDARLAAVNIVATDVAYRDIYKLRLHSGRFLSAIDLRQRKRVCVLGWETAKVLFPRGQVLGQEVRVGQDWYQVVGLLQPMTYQMPELESLNFSEVDRVIYIPVTSVAAGQGAGQDRRIGLSELVLQFNNEANMAAALDTLKRIVSYQRDSQTDSAELDYIVPIELLRQKQKLQQVFQYLLLGVAALMLIVGGIGIMNMMTLNVIARRPEIGLRRAIGATRADIIIQFVTESLVIALVGGLGGVLLGFLLAVIIDFWSQWPLVFNTTAAFLGFFTALAVGVIFGSYPALQAASVSPVKALNQL